LTAGRGGSGHDGPAARLAQAGYRKVCARARASLSYERAVERAPEHAAGPALEKDGMQIVVFDLGTRDAALAVSGAYVNQTSCRKLHPGPVGDAAVGRWLVLGFAAHRTQPLARRFKRVVADLRAHHR
jgi:hypothetical protein